jgi:excisionase family DNA binding protein
MTDSPVTPLRYSIARAALLLGLSRSTLYTRIAHGRLATHKDGRRTFILATERQGYLQRQTKS